MITKTKALKVAEKINESAQIDSPYILAIRTIGGSVVSKGNIKDVETIFALTFNVIDYSLSFLKQVGLTGEGLTILRNFLDSYEDKKNDENAD